jgi:hypothetical protein
VVNAPSWWPWELELTPHLLKRMTDRGFNEVDLRVMLSAAIGYHEDHEEGRFIIEANYDRRRWHVIVEPDHLVLALIVVTAYPID